MKFNFRNIDINRLKQLIYTIILNRKKILELNNRKMYDFIKTKKLEMEEMKIKGNELEDKILVIISCYTDNRLRFNAINSIMNNLLKVKNIDIIIVNSTNLPLSTIIKNTYENNYIKYYEIPNDNFYGFSKWYYALQNVDYSDYKFITFINDSILLHNNINHFFDYTRVKDVEFFGYNDSNQIKYHIQSYLFSIKTEFIYKFKNLFNDFKKYIRSYNDVVNYYELNLLEYFDSSDCFLKLTDFKCQNGKNIFFTNDNLYFKIRDAGCIPITKLKRIKL
jgi:hypothetical protein